MQVEAKEGQIPSANCDLLSANPPSTYATQPRSALRETFQDAVRAGAGVLVLLTAVTAGGLLGGTLGVVLYIIAAIAGLLTLRLIGTFFAEALGNQRPDPDPQPDKVEGTRL